MSETLLKSTPTSSTFDEALRSMRNLALTMASLADRNFETARKGLFARDEGLCNSVIADDEEVDALEVQIDRDGLALMLRFHPVASDLRNVIAMMKLSTNLERVADQTVNIARRVRRILLYPPVDEISGLEPLFEASSRMLKDAIRAFSDADVELARSLKLRDRDLDVLNRQYAEAMTQRMTSDVERIPCYMELVFVARYLERIGDQAKSIGEDTVFAISAEETRHVRPPSE